METLKNLLGDRFIMFWIGVAIVCGLFNCYKYFEYVPDQQGRIQIVKGLLSEYPKFDYLSGGEFRYDYFQFKILGLEDLFICHHCSYTKLNRGLANRLAVGDSIIVKVKKEKYYKVLGIESPKIGVILKLESVLVCERGVWRPWLIFSLAIILTLIVIQLAKG